MAHGSIELQTAMGDLKIGIAEGTAAWLQVNTKVGHVDNQLENATQPQEADKTVEVRGRTSYGGITIHRSRPKPWRKTNHDHQAIRLDRHDASR